MKKTIFFVLFILFISIIFTPEVLAENTLSYQYDANGNLISGDGKYYEYNDANKLVRVRYEDESGVIISEYYYDRSGQRIKKVEDGVTTYYIGKHFETRMNGTKPGNTNYYFANGGRVAKRDTEGNLVYYFSDHLGGTNALTDADGNLLERTTYYPFGEIREGGKEKYTFTGKEKDNHTDFYYFEARYYKPEFKHFTQADLIVSDYYDPQNLNRYAYVRNNPLRYIDPDGKSARSFISGTVAAVGIIAVMSISAPVSIPVIITGAIFGLGVGKTVSKLENLAKPLNEIDPQNVEKNSENLRNEWSPRDREASPLFKKVADIAGSTPGTSLKMGGTLVDKGVSGIADNSGKSGIKVVYKVASKAYSWLLKKIKQSNKLNQVNKKK